MLWHFIVNITWNISKNSVFTTILQYYNLPWSSFRWKSVHPFQWGHLAHVHMGGQPEKLWGNAKPSFQFYCHRDIHKIVIIVKDIKYAETMQNWSGLPLTNPKISIWCYCRCIRLFPRETCLVHKLFCYELYAWKIKWRTCQILSERPIFPPFAYERAYLWIIGLFLHFNDSDHFSWKPSKILAIDISIILREPRWSTNIYKYTRGLKD